MASSGKRKTTMAKLNRERKLVEKRHAKQITKDARRQAAADGLTEEVYTAEGGLAPGEGLTAEESLAR